MDQSPVACALISYPVGVCDVMFAEHLWLTLETFVQENRKNQTILKCHEKNVDLYMGTTALPS